MIYLSYINHAIAWEHEVALGYGYGKEVEQNYYNKGAVVSAKVYKFSKIDDTLFATLDATLANIYSSTASHHHLVAFAFGPAMRAYFADPTEHRVRPYLQASFGPTYLSVQTLGTRTQGSHFAFQTTLEMGSEFGTATKSIDINLRIIHYCNAGIFHPNEGINLAPIISIGYQF